MTPASPSLPSSDPPRPDPALRTDPPLADAVERLSAYAVGISSRRGAAAGLWWQDGVVVTSAAAVWRAPRLQLLLPGGEPAEGRLRGVDPATDIAAISFEGGAPAPAMPLPQRAPDEPAPRTGDFVFAVGRDPSGLVQASFGHVGAAGGEWRSWRGGRIDRLIRLDGGLYPGLTGAPVGDAAGRCLGIASPVFSRLHGVVLPLATLERVLVALLAHGRVAQGRLGVAAQPVRATLDGAGVDGLLVSSVAADGPAAAAGLLVGDVIVSVGGEPVPNIETLRTRLATAAIGSRIAMQASRGGQPVALDLEVAERPEGRGHGDADGHAHGQPHGHGRDRRGCR